MKHTLFNIFAISILISLTSCFGLKQSNQEMDELYAPRKFDVPKAREPKQKADPYGEYDNQAYQKYDEGEYNADDGRYYDDPDEGNFDGYAIRRRNYFYDPFFSPGFGMGLGWGMGGFGMGGFGMGGFGMGFHDPFWNFGWGGWGWGMGWGYRGWGIGWGYPGWGMGWGMNPYCAWNQGFVAGYYAGGGLWNHEGGHPNRTYGHRGSVMSSNTNQNGGGGARSTGSGSGTGERVVGGRAGNDGTVRQITGDQVQPGRSNSATGNQTGRSNGSDSRTRPTELGVTRPGTPNSYATPRSTNPYNRTDRAPQGQTRSSGTVRTPADYQRQVPSSQDYRSGTGRTNTGKSTNPGRQVSPSNSGRYQGGSTPSQSGRGQSGTIQRSPSPSSQPQRSYSSPPSRSYSAPAAPRSGGSFGGSSGSFGGSSGGGGGRSGGGSSGGGGGGGRGPR